MGVINNFPPLLSLLPNRVWRSYPGGRTLDLMEGSSQPKDSNFPEDWIISTTNAINKGREEFVDEGLSKTCINGKEYFLRDLFRQYPQQMLGEHHMKAFASGAGFLLKYLDSAIRLHIQCHPTIAFSQKYLNADAGKTEGYIILGRRENVEPYIYLGFQRSPEQKKFREAIITQDTDFILSHFDKIPVKAGDVFIVPGGLPHAIGEGVFMIEIMEPTDFAVRIEFERGGYVLPEASRFMGRDVDSALSMFDFSEYSLEQLKKRFFVKPDLLEQRPEFCRWSLFDERYTKCFRAERVVVKGECELAHHGFRALIITSGCGKIFAGGIEYAVKAGERYLVPQQTVSVKINSNSGMEAVVALPPEAC